MTVDVSGPSFEHKREVASRISRRLALLAAEFAALSDDFAEARNLGISLPGPQYSDPSGATALWGEVVRVVREVYPDGLPNEKQSYVLGEISKECAKREVWAGSRTVHKALVWAGLKVPRPKRKWKA